MKNLLIIGARGFGREVYDLAMDCVEAGADFYIKGFLDDKKDALEGLGEYPLLFLLLRIMRYSQMMFLPVHWEPLNGERFIRRKY